MPQRRRHSRSESPVPVKHKRSWQPSSSTGGRSSGSREILSPPRMGTFNNRNGNFKQQKFGARKEYGRDIGFRRSRSPRNTKKPRMKSPTIDRARSRSPNGAKFQSRSNDRARSRSPNGAKFQGRSNDRATSKFRQRSHTPPPPPKTFSRDDRGRDNRGRDDARFKRSGSPGGPRGGGPPIKKKAQQYSPDRSMSPPIQKKKAVYSPLRKKSRSMSPFTKKKSGKFGTERGISRSLSPRAQSPARKTSNRKRDSSGGSKQKNMSKSVRKVNVGEKKKAPRLTLNSRFTTDDQEPFRLIENVTIAILRNPNAEASEEVTVKRVFDASLFKMVHKKTEGKHPIFDREEIKIWRHDENLADDPDFERRLVRVKSSTNTQVKTPTDSLARMSPETLRKTFGLQISDRSNSKEREPQIRLDPKPDPRYESKYRKQIEREEGGRKKVEDTRNVEAGRKRHSLERRNSEDRHIRKEDARKSRKGRGDVPDLRQALERRRGADRDDVGGFRGDTERNERITSPDNFHRDSDHTSGRDRLEDGRSVVMDQDRGDRFRSWNDNKRGFRGRGRGYRGANRGGNEGWSINRGDRDSDRGQGWSDRRQFGSQSPPPNNRGGWRGNYRGRGGRGRNREFEPFDKEAALATAQELDDRNKWLRHDDRDVSPRVFRGRGGRGRFASRGFGSPNFRANGRGRGNFRGRRFGNQDTWGANDRRSPNRRGRAPSLEQEWKHDLYDSLQTEEQPHSTTA